jgi:hypothetical protein
MTCTSASEVGSLTHYPDYSYGHCTVLRALPFRGDRAIERSEKQLAPRWRQTTRSEAHPPFPETFSNIAKTALGTIMVTSLANFRSDLNIVKIPNGKYLDFRERLFVNINLLRVGCSGRTALNLDEPRFE